MDFTIKTYRRLISSLIEQRYDFSTFCQYSFSVSEKAIILRHDIDKKPYNALTIARIENEYNIKGTYYFRAVPVSWKEEIIRKISDFGHEVGYHYEDLSFAGAKLKAEGKRQKAEGEEIERQLVDSGIESFVENFEKLRKIAPVKTICMHGSPMSRWDSRLLWKYYDYHDFGIIGEPYFDIDFDRVLYLTDTGRRWDGEGVSVRDKMLVKKEEENGRRGEGGKEHDFSDWKVKPLKYRQLTHDIGPVTQDLRPSTPGQATSNQQPATSRIFHSTADIIKAAVEEGLPDKIMMTFHPQRWTANPYQWFWELIMQNIKNIVKQYFLVKYQNHF